MNVVTVENNMKKGTAISINTGQLTCVKVIDERLLSVFGHLRHDVRAGDKVEWKLYEDTDDILIRK